MQSGRGFTLLEIIVVVVILAILGVAAAPRFLNLSHDARASTMISVGAAMESGLELLYSQSVIDGQDKGVGETVLGDVTIPLLNGYPSVDGGDSFFELNRQVQAWLDIDSVGKDEIISNPNAAPFFVDKSSTLNQIYIFFSNAPTSGNRTEYGCQIRYQNSDAEGYSVRVLISEC